MTVVLTCYLRNPLRLHSNISLRFYRHFSAYSPCLNTIFSGIQPTGVPHLGNYLGAIKQWVHIQQTWPAQTRLIFCIVDLHAITVHQSPERLRRWKMETLSALVAAGLDPARCTIFFQSEVHITAYFVGCVC